MDYWSEPSKDCLFLMLGLACPSFITALDVGIQGQPSRGQDSLGLRKLGQQKGP